MRKIPGVIFAQIRNELQFIMDGKNGTNCEQSSSILNN